MKIDSVISLQRDQGYSKTRIDPQQYQLSVTGNVKSPQYHAVKTILSGSSFAKVNFVPLFPANWSIFLDEEQRKNPKQASQGAQILVQIFPTNTSIYDLKDLDLWYKNTFGQDPPKLVDPDAQIIQDAYLDLCKSTKHPIVNVSIAVNGGKVGDLVFELFSDICPLTVKNFIELLKGSSRSTVKPDKTLTYMESAIHRIVKNGWIQGGDIGLGLGDEGESIYGQVFGDENFVISHNQRGILSMVNRGPHTNNSQFMITLKSQPSFDKRYVAFGRLIDGHDILSKIEDMEVNEYERPVHEVKIVSASFL